MTHDAGAPEPHEPLPRSLRWLASEILLGSLIALLSVFTAFASYQGSMADSEQNKHEIEGMQVLNNANAEYLMANQDIIQDYTYFDSWYLHQEDPDLAEYYTSSFSEALIASIDHPEGPFDAAYYEEVYAYPSSLFGEAGASFSVASEQDERGDRLQLVVMVTAVGLALAAWASLVGERSHMRLLFGALAIVALVLGVVAYFTIPPVSA